MKSLFQICFLIGLMPSFLNFSVPKLPKTSEKAPLITATVSTQLSCKIGNSCATWQMGMKRWHGFRITLTGMSISFYGSNFVYKIYPNPNFSGNPIATFPCTKNVVDFASGILLDNTTYSVKIEVPGGGASGGVVFTTGTGRGTNCVFGPVELFEAAPKL